MDALGPDDIKAMKVNFKPCFAAFCTELSCDPDCANQTLCFSAGKVCCCFGSAALRCPPIWCEPEGCYTAEQGICQISQKMCCIYSEVQFPPGSDIGCGCCGVGCCRTSDDAPPEAAPNE